MKKGLIGIVFSALLIFSLSMNCFAAGNISIKIDGSLIDTNGVMVDNRVLIPMRDIGEALGAQVFWNEAEQSVVVEKAIYQINTSDVLDASLRTIKMWINKTDVRINGITSEPLDVGPKIISGKTMVPLRAVSQWLDARVNWNEYTQTVEITKDWNSSFSDAVNKKNQIEHMENNAIDALNKGTTLTETAAEWISETSLSSNGRVCFRVGMEGFANGFYETGGFVSPDVIYAVPDISDDFLDKDNEGTFNNIRMKVEQGTLYFNQSDLIKASVIKEPVENQYIIITK